MKNKLTVFEAISIITIITISQIVLDFPEYLVDLTGTGTLINLIFLAVISLIFCFIISNIFKNFSNHDIIDISEIIGGKILKFIISVIFIIFLFLLAISGVSNFLFLIRNIFFQNTNKLFVLSIFMVTLLFSATKGFYSLKKLDTVIIGILGLSIFALFFGDNGNFNSNNLVPVFGYNYETTFKTGLLNIFIFNFMLIYFFLMPNLSKKNDYKKIVFSSFGINLALLLISVTSILLYYPTSITHSLTNINTMNTILLVTRRIQISSFLSQTDSIFIFIWSFAILSYICFLINSIIYILNKLFNFKNKSKLSFPVVLAILIGVLLIDRIINIEFLENIVLKYFSIFLTFGISFIILILGYFKNKKKGLNNAKKAVK